MAGAKMMQADWLEAMFTLCYSHPEIEVDTLGIDEPESICKM